MTIPPVTPCSPQASVRFVETRFGSLVAKALYPGARTASVRERRIMEFRRCGELRHAERYGWLSLAGWLTGMKVAAIARIDPTSEAILHRSRSTDILPDPIGVDEVPALRPVGATGLEASDPRDALGYRVAELTAAALRDGLVELGTRRVGGGALVGSLRMRLEEAGHG